MTELKLFGNGNCFASCHELEGPCEFQYRSKVCRWWWQVPESHEAKWNVRRVGRQALHRPQGALAAPDPRQASTFNASIKTRIDYVELTQAGKLPRLGLPRHVGSGALLEIDAASRRSLELTRTLTGSRQGSLLHAVDRTVTGAGARLLANRLSEDAGASVLLVPGAKAFVARWATLHPLATAARSSRMQLFDWK